MFSKAKRRGEHILRCFPGSFELRSELSDATTATGENEAAAIRDSAAPTSPNGAPRTTAAALTADGQQNYA